MILSGVVSDEGVGNMLIRTLNGITPIFGEGCFLAETAVIIGDVQMGVNCSVWYNTVIRGDVNFICIGDRVNIQDGTVVHCTSEKYPARIGNDVSIGHNAIVHGCTISDKVLVGMGAVVMDDCLVESNTIIAAGAVVTQGTRVESGSIYAGVPARKVKDVSPELLAGKIERIAASYLKYAGWYRQP
jgi:carbonic anhydrase/acetyltransferase-like protein (isoleucine patch superfamily)